MKITDITCTVLAGRYDKPVSFAHMQVTERRLILVRVLTDEGVVGLADIDGSTAGCMACLSLVQETFKPLLVGKNPLEIGARSQDMFTVLNTLGRYQSLESYVLGAIDIALWDILGKVTGQPIRRLLGERRGELSCYASLARLEAAQMAEEVGRYAAEGFGGVKIRIGFAGLDDAALVAAARAVIPVGSVTKLMADANSGWSRAFARSRGRQLEEHQLLWLEEPLPPFDIPGYSELVAALSTPIALGEHEIFNRWDARNFIEAKACNIVQPDLRQGISECMQIASIASGWEIPCIPHFFGPPIRFAATLQFLGAIDNHVMCEYPVVHDPLRFELTDPPMRAENGRLKIPDSPGLGITLNEAAVRKYTVA